MKKVSMLISTLGGGGAERVCVILANGLARLGWQVDLVILKHVEGDRSTLLSNEVNLVCLNISRARYAPIALMNYLKLASPSLVLSFNNEVAFAEFFISLFRKRTYSLVHRNITTLSSIPIRYPQSPIVRRLRFSFLRFVLRRADFLVNQCGAMAEDTATVLGEKCAFPYIYNPIFRNNDLSSFKRARNAKKIILCVGRLEANKNFRLAINALALLPSTFDAVELWIAGEGPEKAKLAKLTGELGLSSRVKFLGFQKDVDAIYNRAALVSLTSNFEGFPNVLIEAISNGCPIVSVDCPSGPREIVEQGVNGFLVKEHTPSALAEAYEKALKKDWDRASVAHTADKFSEQSVLQQWDELLLEQLVLLERKLKCQ